MTTRSISQSHSQSQSQSQPRDSEPDFYVGVFGSSAVGKTSIVSQFVHGVFQQSHDPTIEDSCRKIFAFDDQKLLLDILDTAGQEEFASLQDSWIRTRDAFLFVIAYGDVHFNKSFTCLEHYVNKLIKSTNGNISSLPIVVAATRIDEYPPEQYEGQKKIVEQYVKNNKFGYVEISASNREKVRECFMQLVTRQNQMTLAISNTDTAKNMAQKPSRYRINICGEVFKSCKQRLLGEVLITEQQMELQQRLRLNQVQEKDVPVDKILLPVLSLKEFNITRQFRWDILVKSLLYGLVLPLRLLWQLIAFCTFSPDIPYEQLWVKYPRDLDYTRPEAISYDLMGLVVGRKEKFVPESTNDKEKQKASVRNYIWFLHQSREQLVERFFLFLLGSGIFALILYHLYYALKVVYYDDNVSVVETAGPFCLYVVFWVLFSVWISYDVVIDPPLASWHKLLDIELFFGEHFEYKVSAGEYLYAYERAKLRPKQFPGMVKLTIAIVGALYALLPGITRAILGISFIHPDRVYICVSAIVTNFILVQVLLRTIEGQYVLNFNTYRAFMGDLTFLLTRRRNIRAQLSNLFLSFKRYSNALGWLEVRTFLAVDGSLLFSKQELPTLWLVVVSLFLSAFMFYRVYFISGVAYESVLWNGIGFLWLLFLVCLVRIWSGAQDVQSIQKIQERFIAEQRFYLKCRLAMRTMKEKMNTWGNSKTLTVPGESKVTTGQEQNQPTANVPSTNVNTEVDTDEMDVEMVETRDDDDEKKKEKQVTVIEKEILQKVVVETENKEDDWGLRKRGKAEKTFVDERIMMEEAHLDFIDNVKEIVTRKDIIPKFYDGDLSTLLTRTIIAVFLTAVVTVSKLIFEKHK